MDTTAEPAEIPPRFQALLDRGEKPILITGGTTKLLVGTELFSASMEACRLLGRSGVVAAQHRNVLPEQLPDRIEWFDYLPFAKIMPHVAVLIHHGGIGTFSHALLEGVPQVIYPNYSDGRHMGEHLQALGVAKTLSPSQWTPEAVAAAIREMMSEEVGEACQRVARLTAQNDFAGTIAPLIEEVVGDPRFVVTSEELTRASRASGGNTGTQRDTKRRQADVNDTRLDHLSADKRAALLQMLRDRKRNTSNL
ncbi:MAG: hypothetical protein H0T73_07945 [Ardenticatenales bacterium]|nr:hypothetical protein [Ardenticatenales bacterium]